MTLYRVPPPADDPTVPVYRAQRIREARRELRPALRIAAALGLLVSIPTYVTIADAMRFSDPVAPLPSSRREVDAQVAAAERGGWTLSSRRTLSASVRPSAFDSEGLSHEPRYVPFELEPPAEGECVGILVGSSGSVLGEPYMRFGDQAQMDCGVDEDMGRYRLGLTSHIVECATSMEGAGVRIYPLDPDHAVAQRGTLDVVVMRMSGTRGDAEATFGRRMPPLRPNTLERGDRRVSIPTALVGALGAFGVWAGLACGVLFIVVAPIRATKLERRAEQMSTLCDVRLAVPREIRTDLSAADVGASLALRLASLRQALRARESELQCISARRMRVHSDVVTNTWDTMLAAVEELRGHVVRDPSYREACGDSVVLVIQAWYLPEGGSAADRCDCLDLGLAIEALDPTGAHVQALEVAWIPADPSGGVDDTTFAIAE